MRSRTDAGAVENSAAVCLLRHTLVGRMSWLCLEIPDWLGPVADIPSRLCRSDQGLIVVLAVFVCIIWLWSAAPRRYIAGVCVCSCGSRMRLILHPGYLIAYSSNPFGVTPRSDI